MSVVMKYYIEAECEGCAHLFRLEVVPTKISTEGGELDVLRLFPDGAVKLNDVTIPNLPTECPSCGEPIA